MPRPSSHISRSNAQISGLEALSASPHRFTFNGQERTDEIAGTGNHTTALYWEYDTRLGRRWNVDPVDKPWMSSYHAFSNKPIMNIDPNGANDAPIYDTNGEFLGTDDEGLEGKAIIMDKHKFKQGMSHNEALKNNKGYNGLKDAASKEKFIESYKTLPSRPDFDGIVTIKEGIKWAKEHPNVKDNPKPSDALYINSAKLDFGSLSVDNIGLSEGEMGNVNLLNFVNFMSNTSRYSTYALGNTQIQLLNAETGTVKLFSDIYDWDFHNYPLSQMLTCQFPDSDRDRLIFGERILKGLNDSHGFPVFMYGIGSIKIK